jgi:hypothetical protein
MQCRLHQALKSLWASSRALQASSVDLPAFAELMLGIGVPVDSRVCGTDDGVVGQGDEHTDVAVVMATRGAQGSVRVLPNTPHKEELCRRSS